MKKIAITGNIASGKSTVENFIKEKGYEVFDADKICHFAMQNDKKIIHKIKEVFGDITDNIGNIDRQKLGEIVFRDKYAKITLENILHPYVKKQLQKFFLQNSDKIFVFASIPLLFEAKMDKIFDKIILVCADENIRLKRIIKRNNFSKEHATARIQAQLSQEEKMKLADFIIQNNKDIETLKCEVEKILKNLQD